jgi:DNA-binding NarL/FixJ family response regulator
VVIGDSDAQSPDPLRNIPEHSESRLRARTEFPATLLIVVERREFVRGCLTCWLSQNCSDQVIAVADVEATPIAMPTSRCVIAIIGMLISEQHDWLSRQVGALRARHPSLPIVLTLDAEQIETADQLAAQMGLQGYIPSSTSMEVAAAALRLIVAGGCYFPHLRTNEARHRGLFSEREQARIDLAAIDSLTSRQKVVLHLLGSGMPNKMIAERLGMSLSTVKVHVHHIIHKLHVGNRTNVALLAQHIQAITSSAIEGFTFSEAAPPLPAGIGANVEEHGTSDYPQGGEVN